MSRTRILLADDSPAVLAGVRRILEPEFEVVGSVADGFSLLKAAKKLRPDILIVDVMMPGPSCLETIRLLKKRRLPGKAILLTVLQDPALAEEARFTGALGYVVKSSADRDLAEAIHEALQGHFYLSPILRREIS